MNKVETLASLIGIPFNDTYESFFNTYDISEDVECYQLIFCVDRCHFCESNYDLGTGVGFDRLHQIDYKSKIVILNVIDSIIDENENIDTERLTKFCAEHPEQNFLISNPLLNLQKGLNIPNLYSFTIGCSNFSREGEQFLPCEKKNVSNKFISLNDNTKVHRVMAISYLLSKDYASNGAFTFNLESETQTKPEDYKNFTPVPKELVGDFARGYKKFKNREFNRLEITKYDRENILPIFNYNDNLKPVYENFGVEIITGSMFFEKTPILTEKEIQNVFAKNFPIYLNGVGIVRELKSMFDLDLFDDIIDNSYDEIEDHFERMAAAIDRNEHLLNGTTDIQKLWLDNQHRFEDNYQKMHRFLFDLDYQRDWNHQRIIQGLNHFGVTATKKTT
jgi:hypothetical protein